MKLAFDLYLAVPSERVWSALTDPALTEGYFYGSRVQSRFEKGEPIEYSAGGMKMVEGRITAIEQGQKLVVSQRALWDESVANDPASEVSWQVTKLGPSTTKLTLTHDGLDAKSATCVQSNDGWPVILSGLKTLLETGKPLEMPQA
ncbi:MAG TPA: SRPBCC domain-containing protein [Archangium sp.]